MAVDSIRLLLNRICGLELAYTKLCVYKSRVERGSSLPFLAETAVSYVHQIKRILSLAEYGAESPTSRGIAVNLCSSNSHTVKHCTYEIHWIVWLNFLCSQLEYMKVWIAMLYLVFLPESFSESLLIQELIHSPPIPNKHLNF